MTHSATIVTCLIGVLGFDENNDLIDKIFFKNDPKIIAKKLDLMKENQIIDELYLLVDKLKEKGFVSFNLESTQIARKLKNAKDITIRTNVPQPLSNWIRAHMVDLAIQYNFVSTKEDLQKLRRQVSIELTGLRVKKAGEKRDLMITQAILSIDDLDKTANLFMSRLREWFGLHFPELDRIIESHGTYARLVYNLGRRDSFTQEKLEEIGLSKKKASKISNVSEKSIGAELAEVDIEQIKNLAQKTLELYELRQILQNYADLTVKEVAPNIRALVGSLIAARLIALAGGLTNLAKMPASTIQVLGAEKALFRALKTGAKPPKHGVIYQDALIHDSKRWQRGKMSRALAGKLAIAARADAFTKRYIGEKLKEELGKRVDEIREKYAEPKKTLREKRVRLSKPKKHSRKKGRKKRGYRS